MISDGALGKRTSRERAAARPRLWVKSPMTQDHSARTISRPPTRWDIASDRAFRALTHAFAVLMVLLVAFIVLEIGGSALPAMRTLGFGFLTGDAWDANREQFGIKPHIWGTLYSSAIALVIGTALGLAVAVFLSERFLSSVLFALLKLCGVQFHPFWGKLPDRMELLLKNLIELLAAIPSVVYGLWGIFVVIPLIRPMCHWLHVNFGSAEGLVDLALFRTSLSGPGMLPASLVLAIMILPTISAISRDALASVPPKLREAAYGLGATRWEALLAVIIPTAQTGIFGSVLLAFGRALGETMALAMLVGNANTVSWSLFSPANTLAALLANNFPEAGKSQVGVLMYAALVLMGITLVVNIFGALLLQQAVRRSGGRAR
jgi:phosphate transport system permease protein